MTTTSDVLAITAQSDAALAAAAARADATIVDLRAQLARATAPVPGALPALKAGWRRVAGSDFSDGLVPTDWSAYPAPWPDSSHHGQYRGKDGCTVVNGVLRIGLDIVSGIPRVTTLEPYPIGADRGAIEVRMWTGPAVPGWKALIIGWPVSNAGPAPEGEIDGPEGNLGMVPRCYLHPKGGGPQVEVIPTSPVPYTTPAVYRTEWLPGVLRWFRDGVLLREITGPTVPSTPFTWRIQCETSLDGITPTAPAAVFLDYVSVELPA